MSSDTAGISGVSGGVSRPGRVKCPAEERIARQVAELVAVVDAGIASPVPVDVAERLGAWVVEVAGRRHAAEVWLYLLEPTAHRLARPLSPAQARRLRAKVRCRAMWLERAETAGPRGHHRGDRPREVPVGLALDLRSAA